MFEFVTARRRRRRRRRSFAGPLRRLRRHPVVWWAAVVVLAGTAGIATARLVDQAAAVRAEWGALVDVVVVASEVTIGDTIDADDVEVRSMPRAVVPDGAAAEPPIGRVAMVDLHPGEILLVARVAPEGLRGPAALLDPGTRALAVPTGPGTPPLTVGDTVDLLATFEPLVFDPTGTSEATAAPTRPVAAAARVVAVADASVTVAVAAPDASRVAFALSQGAVTLALAGAP
ncbi:MAG: SAF domain-containing protein [Acidimicrobiales bacterium]